MHDGLDQLARLVAPQHKLHPVAGEGHAAALPEQAERLKWQAKTTLGRSGIFDNVSLSSLTPLSSAISCRPSTVQTDPCKLHRSNFLTAHNLFPTHGSLEFLTWTLSSCTLQPSTKSAWGEERQA